MQAVYNDGMRKKNFYRFLRVLLCLSTLMLICFMISINTGYTNLSFKDTTRILFGAGDGKESLIVFDFRLVRIVIAILVGAGLAVSGGIFQTLSKNELASPDFLGVNAGAGFAVLLFTLLYDGASGLFAIPIVSLCGATVAAILVYALAYQKDRPISSFRMTLIGISLKTGIDALDMIFTIRLSAEKYNQVNTWLIGSVYGNSMRHVFVLLPWICIIIPFLIYKSGELNLLRLSEGTAIGLGTELKKARFLYMALATILAAVCVSIGGAIGFVGLVSGNLARRLVGPNHEYSMPITALIGANLLLLSDLIARTIIAPNELLLGLVVSIIGAPYFLYILLKSRR